MRQSLDDALQATARAERERGDATAAVTLDITTKGIGATASRKLKGPWVATGWAERAWGDRGWGAGARLSAKWGGSK